jgi:hypothetical protein
MADVRNHRHHGLGATIIVYEKHTDVCVWVGPRNAVRKAHKAYSEFVVQHQDGLALWKNNTPVRDFEPGEEPPLDFEDQGEKAFGYLRAPPRDTDPHTDSRQIGDWLQIENPDLILYAPPGESMLWTLSPILDKRRNVGMHLHGHQFLADTMVDPERNAEGVESLQNPSYSRIHETRVSDFKGDWCYRSSALFQMGGHGLWGILRVDPHAANFDTCYATPEGERIDLLYNPPVPRPKPSPSDCDLEAATYLTLHCPHLSILLEHCYTCYREPGIEVLICDGFSPEQVKQQRYSAIPLF